MKLYVVCMYVFDIVGKMKMAKWKKVIDNF